MYLKVKWKQNLSPLILKSLKKKVDILLALPSLMCMTIVKLVKI